MAGQEIWLARGCNWRWVSWDGFDMNGWASNGWPRNGWLEDVTGGGSARMVLKYMVAQKIVD